MRKSPPFGVTISFLATLLICGAHAEEPKLTILDCQTLQAGLTSLDGHQELTRGGESVSLAYQFGSAALRLTIQQNLAALAVPLGAFDKARQAIFKEIAGDAPEIKPNTPEATKYTAQVQAAQQRPCDVDLQRIKATDLKLDKNEIPGSVLAALDKILDR
jgi:hypothetical protein